MFQKQEFSRKANIRWMISVVILLAAFLLQACSSTPVGVQVGTDAPSFSLPSTDSRLISLADYAGQPVLLYFHMAVG
ncbi:MAG: redoxin domain-containing protein [Chloroflexi bacterium]|jgi:starvation-inducible outer membrane lipoprotein|nr:redoxin domain-containing protein [Chloroflexota bacterium]